ncbi:MAG: tetratricopeptide repeat protein [Myxococcales bacterium]|nr:tetratricopeptide repeat protein [Myxococcales bacterium]
MRGPRAAAIFLGAGLVLALLVARFGDPAVGAIIGVVAVGLAIWAAMGESAADAPPPFSSVDAPGAAPIYAPVIGGTGFGGVFVETGAAELMLFLFPVADPESAEELAKAKSPGPGLVGMVVVNDGPGDHLFGSRVAKALGIPKAKIWATAPDRAIDRRDGEDSGEATAPRLPTPMELSDALLEWDEDHLRLAWGARYGEVEAAIGAALPDDAVNAEPRASYLVGGVRLDDPKSIDVDVFLALKHVLLVEGEATGDATAVARFFAAMGIRSMVLGARDPKDVVREHVEATREGGEAFSRRIGKAPVPVWIDVSTELAVTGELALAETRLEQLVETVEDHRLWFELGLARLMQEKDETAAEAFRRATELGSDFAWNSLANTLARLDRLDEAVAAIREGLARMPDDSITMKSAFSLYVQAGDVEAAEGLIEEGPWSEAERREMRATLASEKPVLSVQRFGHHAAIARERGTARLDAGDLEGAEAMLRRAVALDPLDLASIGELAFVLGKRDDDEALRQVCERAIAEVPGGELLRFNLGNLAMRRSDFEAARAAFDTLLEKLPEHRDARVNLVSALCALDRHAEAREHLATLETQGLDRDLLERLRDQCMGAV